MQKNWKNFERSNPLKMAGSDSRKKRWQQKAVEMPESIMLSLMASKGLKAIHYSIASDIHADSGSKSLHCLVKQRERFISKMVLSL